MDTIKCYDKYVNAMYSDSDGMSIPEVQYRFKLKYSEARECVLYAQSRGWVAARMAKTDLAVLRLAVGEMLYMDNVPNGVAINEAVYLAKKYGEAQSPKFINAVLSKIYRSIEEEV